MLFVSFSAYQTIVNKTFFAILLPAMYLYIENIFLGFTVRLWIVLNHRVTVTVCVCVCLCKATEGVVFVAGLLFGLNAAAYTALFQPKHINKGAQY